MPPKKLRTFLTNAQKLQLKQFWSEHPDLQLLAVVDWVREHFGVTVGRATLYRIYHTPVEAFAGNAQQKKGRRVKFPQLESDILTFCEENRQLSESNGAVLSDDALLRAAAELRTRHGISETELKLSNGWLHRFKERHALRVAPQPIGGGYTPIQTNVDAKTQAVTESVQTGTIKPARKPRVPPRTKGINGARRYLPVMVASGGGAGTSMPIQATLGMDSSAPVAQSLPILDAGASNTFQETAETSPAMRTTSFRTLTYVTAIAVESITSVTFVRWKFGSGMAHAEHFFVENDGVSILKSASYQLNVELQHSAPPAGAPSLVFKVWAGVELLGQCDCSVLMDGDHALSLFQLQCALPARTVVRVECHAPGAVYSGSRLVVRLLNELVQ